MTHAKAKQRITKLKELINEYRYNYHVLNHSIMSEEAADSLKHELTKLEEEYPDLITPDSPSQRVAGGILKGFKSVEHQERMTSLNDVFSLEELKSWVGRISKLIKNPEQLSYYLDIKMDGLALALVYEDGVLVQGITRGDGFKGEDVTNNIKTIESIPLKLYSSSKKEYLSSGRTEVRGEIVMYKDDFTKLNKYRESHGLPSFANPRNTAAGTIRQLDPKLVSARALHFRAYDIIHPDQPLKSNQEVYRSLKELGFLTNTVSKKLTSIDDIAKYIEEWDGKRHQLEFNTDGIVIKVDDREIFASLGIVGKAPRGAVAFKYAAEQATTKVKDIFVSIGRTGSATPVAILEPVQIAGSTVQMATLHNDQEIKRKDIRIGDSVIVHKAGDIIPEIVEPLVKLRTGHEKVFVMPESCPDCHQPLKRLNQADVVIRCINQSCPSRTYKRIEHFASKSALDIEGLGEKNVIALLNSKLLSDQADIFALKVEDLVKLERFAQVSAIKLINAINEKKNPSLARFIYGLGIRHVGVQTAVDLANKFGSIEKIISSTEDEFASVDGVGEVVAESLVEWFSDPTNRKLLAKFSKYSVLPEQVKVQRNKFKGINFVVSGTLKSMDRERAADLIRQNGGIFSNSVGKQTDYLVVGGNVGESKLSKATQLGTKILSENEFIKLLN